MATKDLQCFICENLLKEPVSTPCGHNFCTVCLTKFWDENDCCQCPTCGKTFETRPNLEVNKLFSAVISQLTGQAKVPAKPGEIPCDVCADVTQKALKSCLDCNKRLCQLHIDYHNKLPQCQSHKLINDVENMEIYICPRHKRPLELFCKDDKTCVCQFCTEGDHRNHKTVSLEEESTAAKNILRLAQVRVQRLTQDRLKKTEDIKQLMKLRKEIIEKETMDGAEVFDALMRSIEGSQAQLLEVMEEKQKAIEGQAKGYLKKIEQEITELKNKDTELEQLSHTENHIHLLQTYLSVCSNPHTDTWTDINIINTHVSGETLRKALSQLQETLEQKFYETDMKWIKQFAVVVTLNPATAHSSLFLSDDGKQVRKGKRMNMFGNRGIFHPCTNVLGTEGFSSGRFYYEVLVRGKTSWGLGVARQSVINDVDFSLSPKAGFWTLVLQKENSYKVVHTTSTIQISLRETPQKVGVFVDYEEGVVSFYDVEARSHIYSFTGQSFSGKLYPYFNPGPNDSGKNSAPLIVLPINYTE